MNATAICVGMQRWAAHLIGSPNAEKTLQSNHTTSPTSPATPATPATPTATPPASAPKELPLSKDLIKKCDDSSSNAIIAAFAADKTFAELSKREMEAILARDDEDAEKLAAGITFAVSRGVIDANPPVETLTRIDVAGKSADAVADEIIHVLGDAANQGCVLVLQAREKETENRNRKQKQKAHASFFPRHTPRLLPFSRHKIPPPHPSPRDP